MPFGFIDYLEQENKSQSTIRSYKRTIETFLTFLDIKYGKQKEIYEVSPTDIKDFFKDRIQQGLKISTANKDLAIIKSFFHYLWKNNKVPIDPSVKIQRFQDTSTKNVPELYKYEFLEELEKKVLDNYSYSPLTKCIYILSMYGLTHYDFMIRNEDIKRNNDGTISIHVSNRIIDLSNLESEKFKEYLELIKSVDSDYIFTSKTHQDEIVRIEVMTLLNHLRKISIDYQLPIRLTFTIMRWSYGYHLWFDQQKIPDQIAEILGIDVTTAVGAYAKLKRIRQTYGENLFKELNYWTPDNESNKLRK